MDSDTVKQILQQSDKAELLEWLSANIGDATKCIIVCARPDGEGGLVFAGHQMGFQYLYELQGFAGVLAEAFDDTDEYVLGGDDEGDQEGEAE